MAKAKLESANISPPKVWEERERLKERAVHYSRQSTESRDRQNLIEKQKEKEKV